MYMYLVLNKQSKEGKEKLLCGVSNSSIYITGLGMRRQMLWKLYKLCLSEAHHLVERDIPYIGKVL